MTVVERGGADDRRAMTARKELLPYAASLLGPTDDRIAELVELADLAERISSVLWRTDDASGIAEDQR